MSAIKPFHKLKFLPPLERSQRNILWKFSRDCANISGNIRREVFTKKVKNKEIAL